MGYTTQAVLNQVKGTRSSTCFGAKLMGSLNIGC